MPALAKSKEGSCAGISEELWTIVWELSEKKDKNFFRIRKESNIFIPYFNL
jgi:hypothetical protein